MVLSMAEVVGPSDSSPTPVRGRASLGEHMRFAECPVCLLSGLAGMWGRAARPWNVGLGSTVASLGRRRADVRNAYKASSQEASRRQRFGH